MYQPITEYPPIPEELRGFLEELVLMFSFFVFFALSIVGALEIAGILDKRPGDLPWISGAEAVAVIGTISVGISLAWRFMCRGIDNAIRRIGASDNI
jgi:hypothetical protein